MTSKTYNVYCDQSGQLQKDQIPVMVIGAVWCPKEKVFDVAKESAATIILWHWIIKVCLTALRFKLQQRIP